MNSRLGSSCLPFGWLDVLERMRKRHWSPPGQVPEPSRGLGYLICGIKEWTRAVVPRCGSSLAPSRNFQNVVIPRLHLGPAESASFEGGCLRLCLVTLPG